MSISTCALREEGDCVMAFSSGGMRYFYPRPPRGGRPVRFLLLHVQQDFYPRPPRGGRPATALHRGKAAVFLSTPSARRATFWRFRNGLCDEISIHALREEGDSYRSIKHRPWTHFYPRPPRGGRPGSLSMICFLRSFLSTPSARRATPERRIQRLQQPISIHALREEGDLRVAM